ncbi:phytoene desaturase family protein [Calothrix sp. PCC 6303]|uniref:phytoene desaturase family protein n=1 Tax=Calothrix sp. PCC 6303 TaxID=1170562 RepID=UPI0002A03B3A|nr:NAD(P)/FAD-dependent oxidoreductase [Calothrix sp. PCC 6303]AFZ01954.1 All-trans-retinol 13,14-reductase [Calothrix sp. PCC 6303]
MFDVIVIGSGIGGLTAAGLLARYGKRVVVYESHTVFGGAAHSFKRQGFEFDSGPSFYCGLTGAESLNPVKQVLDILGESLQTVTYDPLGHYHFPEGSFPVYSNLQRYQDEVAKITPQGSAELQRFYQRMLPLYAAMKEIPTVTLRSDWQLIPVLLGNYGLSLLKMLPHLPILQGSVGDVMDSTIKDSWVRRLIDLECFLLSGLKANGTVAPEVAFMLGERSRAGVEYPIGGTGAIIDAFVRGIERFGGVMRSRSHVNQVLISNNSVTGVQLQNGEVISAPVVISNATLWDTYTELLQPNDLPETYRRDALDTGYVDSFMHLHLGIRSDGLENLTGHHVVVQDSHEDITVPGNTCMISIPSVWDANLAPAGHHVVHAYTLEPYAGWQRDDGYEQKKRQKADVLYQALAKVIPDIRERVTLELIGTPLTHAHYLRRYKGTYGAAIPANQGMFPSTHTPISGLYRVGDSTIPGIGVPAVAASGILCANTLVSPQVVKEICSKLN